MSIVLFDNIERNKLYPLNNACAIADLRLGIFTVKERWQQFTKHNAFIHTEEYLSVLYEAIPGGSHMWIDASVIPNTELVDRILSLDENEALADSKGLIAGKKFFDKKKFDVSIALESFEVIRDGEDVKRIEYPWQLFQWNGEMLQSDFEWILSTKKQPPLPVNNSYIHPENIFVEEGADVSHGIINASGGPVYIGKGATIMEGCMIRGPFAMCENAILKMGAKIYGATTLGPCCIGGGEIKNAVLQGYSNKAHDGYLGDAVIGNWCNLGAGTSNSNVKNNAGIVKMWSGAVKNYVPVDTKCGVIIGDYSRTAINTSFNTGTVVGTCCNIFGEGLLPKYIADFQWGAKGITRYEFEKSLQDIANWKRMKGETLSDVETKVLRHIFERNFI